MANLEAHAGGGGESRHIEIFWNLIAWRANYLSWFNCSLHPQLRKKTHKCPIILMHYMGASNLKTRLSPDLLWTCSMDFQGSLAKSF